MRTPFLLVTLLHPEFPESLYFCVISTTQAMKFVVLSPVRSAIVWACAQTVAKSTLATLV
jgi:hypothetical protein